jgi:hypothetical protein
MEHAHEMGHSSCDHSVTCIVCYSGNSVATQYLVTCGKPQRKVSARTGGKKVENGLNWCRGGSNGVFPLRGWSGARYWDSCSLKRMNCCLNSWVSAFRRASLYVEERTSSWLVSPIVLNHVSHHTALGLLVRLDATPSGPAVQEAYLCLAYVGKSISFCC